MSACILQLTTRNIMRWLASVLLAVALAACAPQEQTVSQPVVTKAEVKPSAPAAYTLRLESWLPETPAKAVVVALHGFNDYSNAFDLPARALNAQGIALYAYDQRGFGTSSNRGIWAGETNLKNDLKTVVRAVKAEYPHTPVYVLGESMGAAVAILAMSEPDFPKTDGLVMVAPALWGGESMNWFYRSMLWTLAHTMPQQQLTGKDLKILASSNIPMLRGMGRDPRVIKKTRVDAVYGMVHLMDNALQKVDRLRVPVLLLYGKKDQVIPPYPVKLASERITAKLDTVIYPEGYHMLLRDLQADTVLSDVAGWMLHRRITSGLNGHWKTAEK